MAVETTTVTISAMDESLSHRLAAEVVRTAYNQMGIHVAIRYVPARRSLELANAGITDGDMARIEGTEKEFPHLIRIPVPVVRINSVIFTRRIRKDIRNWNDLNGLNVGIIQGIRYSEIATSSLKTFRARSFEHLFKLLDHDRIDVAVADKATGEYEVGRHFKNSGIHIIGRPLYSAPLYHYIHEKHADLAPGLEAALRTMMEQGTIDSLWEKFHRNLLHEPAEP